MPPLPPAANIVKIKINWQIGAKAGANILHGTWAGGVNAEPAFVQGLAANIGPFLSTQAGLWDPQTTLTTVDVLDLSSDLGAEGVQTENVPGTRATGNLPANAAALLSYSTPRRWRGGHPRTYLPWLCEGDLADRQHFAAGAVTLVNDAWTAFLANTVGYTNSGQTFIAWGSVSYRTLNAPRVVPVFDPTTFTGMQAEVASMRRRDGRH